MICTNCGSQVNEGAGFCGVCGKALPNNAGNQSANAATGTYGIETAPTQVAPQVVEPMTYYSAVQNPYYGTGPESQALMTAAAYQELKKRLTTCRIWGCIVAAVFAAWFVPPMIDTELFAQYPVAVIGMVLFLVVIGGYPLPFGVCAVWRFLRKHGFLIIGPAAFLLAVMAVVPLFIAYFIGPFVAVYYHVITSKAKTNMEAARANYQAAC